MAEKRRQYRPRRYTEYIIQSFVQDESGAWVYENNVDVVPTYKEAQAAMRQYRRGVNLPRDHEQQIRYERTGRY